MDKNFFNVMCFDKWIGLKAESKKLLLQHYKKIELINWYEVGQNKSHYGISTDQSVPFERKSCTFLLKYQDFVKHQQEYAIRYHLPTDKSYPNYLKQFEAMTNVLFSRGNASLMNQKKKVAIVGSRKPTPYGQRVAKELAAYLAKYDVCVVSGMAMGIDSIAHYSVLEQGGSTIAVLASGITNPYPKTNFSLYRRIIKEEGAIISEKEGDQTPQKYDFPLRNRLISGISDVVVVIEAAEKSGTITTAHHAMEQGKNLFALPGNIFSEHSKGCNRLISEGAYPLIAYEDILVCLGISNNSPIRGRDSMLPEAYAILSETSQKIYKLLLQLNTVSIDEVKKELNCEDSDVIAAFSELVCEELCIYASLNEIQIA